MEREGGEKRQTAGGSKAKQKETTTWREFFTWGGAKNDGKKKQTCSGRDRQKGASRKSFSGIGR